MEVIVTTAIGCQIGTDPHGMRIVTVGEKEIRHEYHGLDHFPKEVQL
jgi:hypothetical protein